MNHQLIQTICTLAPYGLQVRYNDEIWTIDALLNGMSETATNEKKMMVSLSIYLVESKQAKLLLHSTSKLTEPILEGGKVPIEEYWKADEEQYFSTIGLEKVKQNLLCGYIDLIPHIFIQWLIENHFNLFNLSEEYFTEKSTVKERGIKIIDKSKDFFKDLDRYENQFYTNECDCEGKDNFAYDRTVANGEVWHCTKHNIEIMTDEQPREDNY